MERNDKYKIVRYTSESCPEEILTATAAFYTFIFNNASGHFFVHRDTGASLGRRDITELAVFDRSYVPNAVLKRLHAEIYDRNGYSLWHGTEITLKNIQRKLCRDGQLVVLVDAETGTQVHGFSFGRRCTLIEALRTEEWLHPYVYSEIAKDERFQRDEALFIERINTFLKSQKPGVYNYNKVALDTPVYCWNAAGLAPELQGNGYMRDMNDVFFRSIPKEWGGLLFLGEASTKKMGSATKKRGTNLEQFQQVGAEKIMKISEDLYLIGAPVEKFAEGFIRKKEQNSIIQPNL